MTRAQDSEEVGGVKEEKTTNIVSCWDSPNLSEDLVDRIYDMLRGWLADREPVASDFFHYCCDLCESQGEADQAWVWMLNLIAHFVAKDESWLDSIHTAKDWRQLGVSGFWEVPPPLWLVEREEEGKKEDEKKKKESENMEESLECSTTSPVLGPSESAEESLEITTASPLDESWIEPVHTAKEEEELKAEESLEYKTNSPILDCGWGKGLPAPSPTATAPSTPMWRPWEEEDEEEVADLSAAVQKRKRRSPAAAARSRKRLQQWKEKKNRSRLETEQRTTPLRLTEQMRGTRLIERLEEKTSQVGGGAVHQGASPGRVEGETVFFCNYTKNSMHPQSIQSSLPSFAPVATSPFALSEGSLSFPNCETLWSSGLRAT